MHGQWGDRERVTGWKHITLPGVPTMSCCPPPSGLLGSERGSPLRAPEHCTKKYRMQWIDVCLGQVGMPKVPPLKRPVWHCPLQHLGYVASCCSAPVQGLGTPLGEAFDGTWHPSAVLHVDAAFPRVKQPTSELCTVEEGCSPPLTRSFFTTHQMPLSPHPSVGGSVPAWQLIAQRPWSPPWKS